MSAMEAKAMKAKAMKAKAMKAIKVTSQATLKAAKATLSFKATSKAVKAGTNATSTSKTTEEATSKAVQAATSKAIQAGREDSAFRFAGSRAYLINLPRDTIRKALATEVLAPLGLDLKLQVGVNGMEIIACKGNKKLIKKPARGQGCRKILT